MLLLASAACGTDPDSTEENCQLYQDDYCGKQADCAVELNDIKKAERESNEQACHADFESRGLSCGSLGGVSATFEQCLEDLEKWPCVQFYDVSSPRRYVPLSCVNVLEP
jgi:hypothetical protein